MSEQDNNVTPFKKIEGGKPDGAEGEVQKPRHFYFYMDRGTVHKEGYLICTPSFIAVGNGDGTIVFVATLEHLHFVDGVDEPYPETYEEDEVELTPEEQEILDRLEAAEAAQEANEQQS